jgi:hypothetical protein
MNESKPNGEAATAVAEPPRENYKERLPITRRGVPAAAFALPLFYKVLEKRQPEPKRSSPSPGSKFIAFSVFRHGAQTSRRAVPLTSGISLARPDLHVFLFGGDGDGFSIGATISITARKNINMTISS